MSSLLSLKFLNLFKFLTHVFRYTQPEVKRCRTSGPKRRVVEVQNVSQQNQPFTLRYIETSEIVKCRGKDTLEIRKRAEEYDKIWSESSE